MLEKKSAKKFEKQNRIFNKESSIEKYGNYVGFFWCAKVWIISNIFFVFLVKNIFQLFFTLHKKKTLGLLPSKILTRFSMRALVDLNPSGHTGNIFAQSNFRSKTSITWALNNLNLSLGYFLVWNFQHISTIFPSKAV